MNQLNTKKYHPRIQLLLCGAVLPLMLLVSGIAPAQAATLAEQYPESPSTVLKSAQLADLDKDTILIADGMTIKHSQLLESMQGQDPKLRSQLKKNLLYVLEQDVIRRVLVNKAREAGFASSNGDDNRMIQAFFEKQTQHLTVTEEESRAFYEANEEMIGGNSYEEVAYGIGPYLLQEKKQQAIEKYIDELADSVHMRINSKWVEEQHQLALDNPVDKARRTGKPTLVEFGATGCVPCEMMQPILDNLRKDYPQQLNVVFVHVGEEQILGARYGIRSIPVQAFFDAKGREVFRHVGFFAQADVERQLKEMGVAK